MLAGYTNAPLCSLRFQRRNKSVDVGLTDQPGRLRCVAVRPERRQQSPIDPKAHGLTSHALALRRSLDCYKVCIHPEQDSMKENLCQLEKGIDIKGALWDYQCRR